MSQVDNKLKCPMYRTLDDMREEAKRERGELGELKTKCITECCDGEWHYTLNAKRKIQRWDEESGQYRDFLVFVGEVVTGMCPVYHENYSKHIEREYGKKNWHHISTSYNDAA